MVQALPLDEEHVPGSGINWDAVSTKESSWGDTKDVLDIGAYGVVEAIGGAGQFITGGSDDSVPGRLRRWAGEGADANYRELSPEAQRNFSAGFLPNAERSDIWDDDVSIGSAVGLKLTAALPSLAAALIPGGLAARVALAAGASRAGAGALAGAVANTSSGAQTGGSLYNDIQDAILDEPDHELQKENEIYRGMRASGLSEEDAKAQVIQSAAGFLPLYMGALTIMTGKVGVEGMLAKGITGQGARRGVMSAAGMGAIGEGGQEGLESATQEVLTQKGKVDAAVTGAHFDWYKALEAAAEGLATGGVMGAGVNAVVGRGRDPVADLDPAVAGTLDGTINTPAVPTPDEPTESPDVTAGKIAAIQRPPEPGEVVPAVPSATAPTPVAEVVGTTAPIFEKVSGVSAAEAAAMAAPQTAGGTTPARDNIATQTDVGYDPDADFEESPAPPPIPPSPPPSPETHAITAVDPTKDVRGQPLPAPPPAPVAPAPAPAPAGPVPIGPALAEAGYIAPDVAVPPVTPQVTPQPAAAASSLTPEERAAYEAEINARVGVKPTGRVLTDEAAEAAAAAEAAQKAKMARPGTRMTEQKKARAEAGLPVMTAQEARKYDRQQKRIKIAEQTKAAMDATPLDVAKMTTPKAIRAYINDLLSKIPDYKEAKTSRFTDEDDPHLKLLAMARSVRASSDMNKLGDFIRTDFALRQGVDIVSEYRKAQADKSTPTVVEGMGGTTEEAPAAIGVQEDSEPEPTPEEDAAREKAEFDRKMAARRAESAAAAAAKAAAPPKREVKVETKGRKRNAWDVAREKRQAEEAAKAEAEAAAAKKAAAKKAVLTEQAILEATRIDAYRMSMDASLAEGDKYDTKRFDNVEEATKKKNKLREELEKAGLTTREIDAAFNEGNRLAREQRSKFAATTEAKAEKGLVEETQKILDAEAIRGESDQHPDWATEFEREMGGKVIYSKGNIALLEGFNLYGNTIYAPIRNYEGGGKLPVIVKQDVETLPSKSYNRHFSWDEVAELQAVAKSIRDADKASFAANPNGPFKEGKQVEASPSVPKELVGVATEWAKMLGIEARIYIADKNDVPNLTGLSGPWTPIRAVGRGSKDALGGTRYLPKVKAHVIEINPNLTRQSAWLETLAHEMGHVLQTDQWDKARPDLKAAVLKDFEQWKATAAKRSIKEHITSLRTHTVTKQTKFSPDMDTVNSLRLGEYFHSFSEYFADQVARWATSQEQPLTVVDKFFSRIAKALRKLYASAAGKPFLPTSSMKRYLDNQTGVDFPQRIDTTSQGNAELNELVTVPQGDMPPIPAAGDVRAANAAWGRPLSEERIKKILEDLRDTQLRANQELMEREGRFSAPIRMSLKELMSQKEANAFRSKFQRGYARFLQARFEKLIGDTPVLIVDGPTMAKIQTSHVRQGIAITGQLPAGFYYHGEIVINGTLAPDQFTHTLLHEGAHAAYQDAFNKRPDVARHVNQLIESVKRHYESPDGIINVPEPLQYALTDPHEFISEGLANAEMQAILQKIPSRGGDRFMSDRYRGGHDQELKTLWDEFVNILSKIVMKAVGKEKTILRELMLAHRELDAQANEQAIIASWDQPAAQPLIARDKVAAAKEAITPRGSLKRQSMGLALQTFDNIRQRYPNLFPTEGGDALERLNDGLRKAARTGDKIREDAMKMAERFRVLPPEVKDAVADLVTSITTHNINVGPGANNDHLKSRRVRNRKSISEVPKAQAAYDALPAEAQTWIREAGAFYRDIENQTRHEHLTQMLKLQEKTYAPSTYSAVVNAVMDGKLTDEHRAMLDDDNLFTALRDLTGFARIKGYYFPLARHGDVVVNTYDDLGDIGSGKVLAHLSDKRSKVIEWTAATDKEAEDAYNAYIDATDLVPPTSVGKVWRDMQGNEISAKDAKGVAHTVSLRARMHVQGTYFFDTEKEALAFHKENPRSTPPMQKAQYRGGQDMNNQQLAAIMKGVQRSNADPAQKAMMESILRDASIRLMSGGRVQKHRLKRLGAKGASQDLARTTFDYANTAGGYLGKVRHMPEIRAVLAEMHKIVDGYDDKDKPLRGQILDEMHQRIDDNVFDPQSYPKWIQRLLAISFIDKLASPAYSIINATQVMMVTYPVLAGHHGPLKASLEIARAYRSMGALGTIGQGMMNVGRATKQFNKLSIDTSDLVGSLLKNVSKEKDGEFLRKVINYANERTPLAEAGMELAGSMMGGSKAIDMGLAKVDRIFRQMSLAVEVMNRGATLIAAGRLARLKMDEDAAIKFAFDTMQNTQGDYTPVNTPRAFKHPWAAPFLQFKRYAQMMSMLVYDMVKNAFAGATRADKVKAWRQIAGLVAVQVAMAGALGLPGMELAKIVLMAGAALGLTDGYDEFERYLQEVAKNTLGEAGGEMLTRGVISRGIGMAFGGHGIDLSSRLSLADMWTGFEEPKGTTKDDYMAYFGQLALGAPGSLAADWITGTKDAVDGNFGKAFEKLFPVKVVADLSKAVRAYGDPTANIPITAPEAILQTIGLRSGRMANRGEEIGKKIATQKDLEKDKKELNSLWMGATTKGEELKAQVRIAEHNKRVEKIYGKSGRAAQLKVHIKGLNKAKDERASERARVQGY